MRLENIFVFLVLPYVPSYVLSPGCHASAAACPRWQGGPGSRSYSSLKGFLNVWMNGWVTMCLLYYF